VRIKADSCRVAAACRLSLAAFPGRKNVALVLGGLFPWLFFLTQARHSPFGAQSDNQQEVRKEPMLCLAQPRWRFIPSAPRASPSDSLYSAGADSRLTTRSELSRPPGRGATAKTPTTRPWIRSRNQTGGAAFYSSNSLTDAIDRVAGHGSNFYTLTYTSTNPHH